MLADDEAANTVQVSGPIKRGVQIREEGEPRFGRPVTPHVDRAPSGAG